MKPEFKKIFQFLYGPFINVVYFFMRSYRVNRDRLNYFLNQGKVKSVLQSLAIIILLLWIVTFLLAPEEKRKELTQEMKQSFEKFRSSPEK
ncbi:MAG: hypothetical protein OEY09_11055 [Gammaproteobacteria bacterium]|nr:hypothetical protein [Gammaproteobacteria bacterium]